MTGDEKLLTAAQGVGKKIAQRIILELKDKIGGSSVELDFSTGPVASAPAQQGGNVALARAALQELGYSPAEVQTALKGADPNATTEELVRHALRAMVMKG
jgi:Holliday junction DNA helicase RuvA